jgi:hypothetical protein
MLKLFLKGWVRESNRRGWIWSNYIICMHGNITMKPLCTLIYTNKKSMEIVWLKNPNEWDLNRQCKE